MFLKTYEKMFLKTNAFSAINTTQINENKSGMVLLSFYTYLKLFLAGLDLKTFKSSLLI
jgi:hypothetical protein